MKILGYGEMKDRLIPCKFYICAHNCKKGKDAEVNTTCQHCPFYQKDKTRLPFKTNDKKKKLEKARKKDMGDY